MLVAKKLSRGLSESTHRFDFNFLLTYDLYNGNFNFFKQFNAKKYDVAEIDIYGAALRNGVWKGKRVIGKDI